MASSDDPAAGGRHSTADARTSFARKILAVLQDPLQGKLRRACLAFFRPNYVLRQSRERRGACRQCGRCCRLMFRCPFLLRDNRCRIYNGARMDNCKIFPIDARDLRNVRYNCGFHFDKPPESPLRGERQ